MNQEKSENERGDTVVLRLWPEGLLDSFDEGCQECRALRQFRYKNGFMRSVCAFADAAQSVERGDAEGCGEVSIRTAAD